MKHAFFILTLCIACTACTTEPPVPRATLVSVTEPITATPKQAANVGVTPHGVTAYYLDSDAEFCLYFNQCAVLAFDGKMLHLDCDVYQTSPGVYVGDFGNGEFVKLNTMTGTTTIYKGGANRAYHKQQTP